MKKSMAIALFASVALTCNPAGANTCEKAEAASGLVETNLTGNAGCQEQPMKGLCKAFFACLHRHQACLVGGGKVYGGSTVRDFRGVKAPLTFGARRVTGPHGEKVCFLASLGQAPGEEVPSWSWTLVESDGRQGMGWETRKKEWLGSPSEFFIRSTQSAARVPPRSPGKQ